MIKKILLSLIKGYQKTISPDHGIFSSLFSYNKCKYYPSCSEYTYRSIEIFGPFYGLLKGIKRIIRCNPFSDGGYDPVINK